MTGSETYPAAPPGWQEQRRRSVGPFTTGVTFRHPDGSTVEWSSRRHRKHTSRLSRPRGGAESVVWAPRRASWWISLLFTIGATCFVTAPVPGFAQAVGQSVDGGVFFVGSVFFTSAATLQWLETINADRDPRGCGVERLRWLVWEPRRIDWWSTGVQLAGTVFFNVTTFQALSTSVSNPAYNQVVWRPDALGSVCFLVSGYLAYVEVTGGLLRLPGRGLEAAIVTVNLLGCLAFGVSAATAYVLPTGTPANVTLSEVTTTLGAVGFLVGALLMLPEAAADEGPMRRPDEAAR